MSRTCYCETKDHHPDCQQVKKQKYKSCVPHGKFPCRECGTVHFKGCRCPSCVIVTGEE